MATQQDILDEIMAKKLQQEYDEEFAKQQQANLNKQPIPSKENLDYDAVIRKVISMPATASKLCGNYGLSCSSIVWEDNARNKNSSWGPCISDMTLTVTHKNATHTLPVIRSPNYEDLTWDVPIEKIPILVGNEHSENLRSINLKQYLNDFRHYLSYPLEWPGNTKSLLASRDTHVVMSAQACFLPVPPLGGEATFNVSLYNYQSYPNNPAVLTIVANEKGTSAQIIDNFGNTRGQKLYFNKNGKKCSFLGQRLSQHRIEEGREHDLGKPMNDEEKEKNMILIIQIPLKYNNRPFNYHNGYYSGDYDYSESYGFNNLHINNGVNYNNYNSNINPFSQQVQQPQPHYAYPSSASSSFKFNIEKKEKADVEDAIIKVGEEEGKFREINKIEVKRDNAYPIRVTLQYYKATSNGVCDDKHMNEIWNQLKEARKYGSNIGSLVVGNSNRPTEIKKPNYKIPLWWDDFWIAYGSLFPQYNSNTASELLFVNGRFTQSTLAQCQQHMLDILGQDNNKPNNNNPPIHHVEPILKPSWHFNVSD